SSSERDLRSRSLDMARPSSSVGTRPAKPAHLSDNAKGAMSDVVPRTRPILDTTSPLFHLRPEPRVLRVEGRFLDDHGTMALAKDVDVELRPGRRQLRRNHAQRQRATDAPTVAARRAPADQIVSFIDRLRAAGVRVRNALHPHGDEGVLEAALLPIQKPVAADEITFFGTDEAVKAAFQRGILDRQLTRDQPVGLFEPQ